MNWVMLILALAVYGLAGLLFWLHSKWKATAIKVTGVVSSVREGLRQDGTEDNRMEKVWYPTVKYEGEGQSFEHAFGETSASSKPFTTGRRWRSIFSRGRRRSRC